MTNEVILHMVSLIMYVLGFVGILWVLIATFRQIKTSNIHNHSITMHLSEMQTLIKSARQDAAVKWTMTHELLKDVHANLKIVESKIGDLTMRVNITEVRLEERKPQQFMVPTQLPPIEAMRRKPGRKPKQIS